MPCGTYGCQSLNALNFLPLLLLLALVVPVNAGGGESWYVEAYERCFIHAIVLIVLVCLALVFEMSWHSLAHSATETYHYGEVHDAINRDERAVEMDANGNIKHVLLWNELLQRAGGEFMSLGFLAFFIFILNQAGFFDLLEASIGQNASGTGSNSSSSSAFHYPVTQYDWLHVAEVVHVKLFVAMLLYFLLVSRLVKGAVKSIRTWEELRLRSADCAQYFGEGKNHSVKDVQLNELHMLRQYFSYQIVTGDYGINHEFIREKILEEVGIDDDEDEKKKREEILNNFDEHFSLSAYLALNVETAVCDSIHVHKFTWCVVICFFAFFATLHRYAGADLSTIVMTFSVFAFVIFAAIMVFVSRQEKRVKEFQVDIEAEQLSSEIHSNTCPKYLNAEKAMLRALQAFMFMITIVFADALIDFQEWKKHFVLNLAEVLVYVVLTLIMAKFLQKRVPHFLALMACPPHVNEENMSLLFDVLFNDHPLYRASEGFETYTRKAYLDSEAVNKTSSTAVHKTNSAAVSKTNSYATPGAAVGPGLMRKRFQRTRTLDLQRGGSMEVIESMSYRPTVGRSKSEATSSLRRMNSSSQSGSASQSKSLALGNESEGQGLPACPDVAGVAMELAELLGQKEQLTRRLRELGYQEPERLPPAATDQRNKRGLLPVESTGNGQGVQTASQETTSEVWFAL